MLNCFTDQASTATPIVRVDKAGLSAWLETHPAAREWIATLGFKGEPGTHAFVPGEKGQPPFAFACRNEGPDGWAFAGLSTALPEGNYRFDADPGRAGTDFALGWALGSYDFTRYRKPKREPAKLAWPAQADKAEVERLATAIFLARDLINTPAEDMGPQQVDNAIAGNAMRPRDILRTRAGKTVEIGNTDAEGRLILCDALAEADTEAPDLLIDCATLTGAAKIALGTELQALFCNDDQSALALLAAGFAVGDPLWRMPIWRPYRRLFDSPCADMNNVPKGSFGAAICAALYLAEFVSAAKVWAHIDMFAANQGARPGRPEGGEATGLRALYAFISGRYR